MFTRIDSSFESITGDSHHSPAQAGAHTPLPFGTDLSPVSSCLTGNRYCWSHYYSIHTASSSGKALIPLRSSWWQISWMSIRRWANGDVRESPRGDLSLFSSVHPSCSGLFVLNLSWALKWSLHRPYFTFIQSHIHSTISLPLLVDLPMETFFIQGKYWN